MRTHPSVFPANPQPPGDTGNSSVIANEFNNFYVNIGPLLASKIPYLVKSPTDYIHTAERLNIIPGWDDVTAKVLKRTGYLYIEQLVHLFNLSLSQGIFPDQLKIAEVVPILKSGNCRSINNYRPVSGLPLFSKVLEKIVYSRLLNYITANNILYRNQFGFRKSHSTNIALLVLVDKIIYSLDNGDIVLGVFLDFSKAFDTVNHSILLQKLSCYGITGICNQWFASYLNSRKQYVVFNNQSSQFKYITCGVPQGYILGPVLFTIRK